MPLHPHHLAQGGEQVRVQDWWGHRPGLQEEPTRVRKQVFCHCSHHSTSQLRVMINVLALQGALGELAF